MVGYILHTLHAGGQTQFTGAPVDVELKAVIIIESKLKVVWNNRGDWGPALSLVKLGEPCRIVRCFHTSDTAFAAPICISQSYMVCSCAEELNVALLACIQHSCIKASVRVVLCVSVVDEPILQSNMCESCFGEIQPPYVSIPTREVHKVISGLVVCSCTAHSSMRALTKFACVVMISDFSKEKINGLPECLGPQNDICRLVCTLLHKLVHLDAIRRGP